MQPFASSFINIYPPGIRDLMLYTKSNYKNPVIYISENGMSSPLSFLVVHSFYFLNFSSTYFEFFFLPAFNSLATIIELFVGVDELNNKTLPDVLNDEIRVSYHHDHLLALRSAIRSAFF